jgi:hypothetical protein
LVFLALTYLTLVVRAARPQAVRQIQLVPLAGQALLTAPVLELQVLVVTPQRV